MSLSNMVVFQEYKKMTMMEVLNIQVSAFNEAAKGCLILKTGNNDGDFTESSYLKAMPDMVHSRNPYIDQAVTPVTMAMDKDRSVKVARRGGPVKYDAVDFKWINRSPEDAGIHYGKNFAEQKFREYFDLAVAILKAAMSNDSALIGYDATLDTVKTLNYTALTKAAGKFGDAYTRIKAWLMHSKPVFDLWSSNLTNDSRLFNYGGVIVMSDPMGNPIIMSDTPSLVNTAPTPDTYNCLGLTEGAITFEENDDFTQAMQEVLLRENIGYLWQSEWSFNASVKGYRWDDVNGGKAPNDAALVLNTNWDKIAVNTHKDLPGVNLVVN